MVSTFKVTVFNSKEEKLLDGERIIARGMSDALDLALHYTAGQQMKKQSTITTADGKHLPPQVDIAKAEIEFIKE